MAAPPSPSVRPSSSKRVLMKSTSQHSKKSAPDAGAGGEGAQGDGAEGAARKSEGGEQRKSEGGGERKSEGGEGRTSLAGGKSFRRSRTMSEVSSKALAQLVASNKPPPALPAVSLRACPMVRARARARVGVHVGACALPRALRRAGAEPGATLHVAAPGKQRPLCRGPRTPRACACARRR